VQRLTRCSCFKLAGHRLERIVLVNGKRFMLLAQLRNSGNFCHFEVICEFEFAPLSLQIVNYEHFGIFEVKDRSSLNSRIMVQGADLGPFLPSDQNQQLILITVLTIICVLFGRILANAVGNGQTPPIFEGLPFIGGLLKFTRVS